MRLIIEGNTPSPHPALFILEQLIGRVADPPVSRGQITLYVNGGRITDVNPDYLLPTKSTFDLTWRPLSKTQQAAVQAVADLLPELERTRVDCRLVVRINHGEPVLPLVFQGRYSVNYETHQVQLGASPRR